MRRLSRMDPISASPAPGERPAAARIFAIGTLKAGFPLHERGGLATARFLGAYRSVKPYPLLIAGRWYAPMIFDEPGIGRRVTGELYEVSAEGLANLDRLESVGAPGNFRRLIEVEPVNGGAAATAFGFMKARELAEPLHSGYLETYEDRRFIPPEARPSP
jgi:gamma-glutamylaminecyclotransferase